MYTTINTLILFYYSLYLEVFVIKLKTFINLMLVK